MRNKKKVTALDGKVFWVDTSDEACGKFGFRHGDRIIDHDPEGNVEDREGTVIGVAPATEGTIPEPKTLWYKLDCNRGRVSYSIPFKRNVLPA